MAMSSKLNNYLAQKEIPFTTLEHEPSHSSLGTALASGIPVVQLAKAVLLEDHQGHHLMAVLPSNSKVNLKRLNDAFQAQFHLAPESKVHQLFDECEDGAVPPVGEAFRINTVYDDTLLEQSDVYMEAGDHHTVLHMDKLAFNVLCSESKHFDFSQRYDWVQ